MNVKYGNIFTIISQSCKHSYKININKKDSKLQSTAMKIDLAAFR